MKSKQNLLLIVAAGLAGPAASTTLASTAQAERLAPAMPCELEVEKRASEIVFDLQLVLGRQNALSSDEFPKIRSALDTLEKHGNSDKARSCFREYPDQKRRYSRWLQQQAGEVVAHANRRLDATCTRRTQIFIHSNTLRIDDAVAANRLALAARHARAMRDEMNSDEMIARCPATADEVQRLRSEYLPSILNQAALPKVQEKMSEAYFSARFTFEAVRDALRNDGKLTPAPTELETQAGQDALRVSLSQCVEYDRALTELGAQAKLGLQSSNDDTVSRSEAADFCERASMSLDATFTAILAHNKDYRATMLARWRRVSLKGWGMEKAFEERGRPQSESVLGGGAIVWNYHLEGECSQLRFTPRGKLMSEADIPCSERIVQAK